MTPPRPDASIIVVAYGKRAVTEVCLASLERSLAGRLGSSIELVLVDNASPDDTLDLFAKWEDRATVLRLAENRNFAGGCNAGAAAATGSVLVFLNNDTEVGSGAIEGLVARALEPSVGAAGLRLLYPDGRLQHAGFGFREDASGVQRPFHYFHGEPGSLPAAGSIYDLEAVTAACIVLRREVFQEEGGFDAAYANGWEDIDLCLKLRRRGLRVVYCGDLSIVHHEGATGGKSHDACGNEDRFRKLWDASLRDDRARIADLFGARFRAELDGPEPPHPSPSGSRFSVEGLLRSCAPEGDEARALLRGLAGGGLAPAAREWFPCWITPQLDPALESMVHEALGRAKDPKGVVVQVPPEDGARGTGMPTIVRVANTPRTRSMRTAFAAWVASAEAAQSLVVDGFPPGAVHQLDPPIQDCRVGQGGGGIAAVLPAHDLPLAESVARAVAGLGTTGSVRLVWTVVAPWLVALAREWIPDAIVETRTANERLVADIAAAADVFVHIDRSDGFQRLTLSAASRGAAPVAREGGAAGAVLGRALHVPETFAVPHVRAAIEKALEGASGREARWRTVRERCGNAASEARLLDLTRAALEAKEIRSSAGAPRISMSSPSPRKSTAANAQVAYERRTRARDEAALRPETALMWYPELPDPDRSSGHRRAFEMLRSLARIGCRPTLLTFDSAGADGAIARLEDDGVEVCAADRPGVDAMAVLHRGFSVALVSFYDVAERAIPLLRAASPATRIVVDTVDIHYRRLERAAVLAGDGDALAAIPGLRRRELGVYALADLVLAVSEEEQDLLCEQLSEVAVAVVPNVHHVAEEVAPASSRRGAIFVGGFGHPPNVDAVRFLCDAVAPRLREHGYQGSVAVAGSRMPDDLAAHARQSGLEVLGFLPSVDDELARRRVSLAPLRYGAGLKGKVGEALAAGVPVVGTTIAAEGYLDPERGMLVEDGPDGFARAACRLLKDDALWQRLSDGGRRMIREQLGPDRCDRELTDVLEHLFAESIAGAR